MGQYNPDIHHRRSIRLEDYDYSQEGAYFVTVCTLKRVEVFGEIKNNDLHINEQGEIVQAMWNTLPRRFSGIELDHFVVMPNHIHGIIVRTQRIITGVENNTNKANQSKSATMSKLTLYRKSPNRSQMLYEMVRTFKAAASYHLRRSGKTPDFHWQREYYEHIIRNAKELNTIRTYIINNPIKWQEDKLHPLSTWHAKRK